MAKQLLEYIIKTIVHTPSAVEVAQAKSAELTTFTVKVAPEDRGKLIGREGRTIRSLRVIAQQAAGDSNGRCTVELAD